MRAVVLIHSSLLVSDTFVLVWTVLYFSHTYPCEVVPVYSSATNKQQDPLGGLFLSNILLNDGIVVSKRRTMCPYVRGVWGLRCFSQVSPKICFEISDIYE